VEENLSEDPLFQQWINFLDMGDMREELTQGLMQDIEAAIKVGKQISDGKA
jgi:hypothetical protein